MRKLLRDASREGWLMGKDGPTDAEIQSGSQQRIADALERLASGTTEVETLKELEAVKKDRDYHSSRRAEEIVAKDKLYRTIRAYRGVITKLKKRLEV